MLSYNLLRRLSLLIDFKINKHSFKCLHSSALTDDVQPLENFSLGTKWPLSWAGSNSLKFYHHQLWREFVSWSLSWKEKSLSWSLDGWLKIHASMLCKRDPRVNWWNAILLTTKSQVFQTRAWWTPHFETWNTGFVHETRIWSSWLRKFQVCSFEISERECGKLRLLKPWHSFKILDTSVTNSVSWSLRRGSLLSASEVTLIYASLLNYQTRV